MVAAPEGSATRTVDERRWYLGFAAACVAVTLIRLLWAGASNLWTGADSLLYCTLARNIAEGRGFVIDYVRFFYNPYPTIVGRPEDLLSPLFPLSMVPFLKLLGDTYLAYSAPAILSGGLGLPLAVYCLARELRAEPRLALAAGVVTLFHPLLFLGSQSPMTDVPFAFLTAVCCLYYLRLGDRFWSALPTGVFLGLAWLVRPTALWLFPLLPLLHAWRRRRLRAMFAPEMFVMGISAIVVMLPWLLRNLHEFGSPMYSVYAYVGPRIGRIDIAPESCFQFWWGAPLPKMSERWTAQPLGEAVWILVKYLLWAFDMTFVGTIKSANVKAVVGLSQYNYHLYQGLLGIPALFALWRRRREFQAQWAAAMIFSLILFIAGFNVPAMPRYFFASYPLVIIYGCLGWDDWLAHKRQAFWIVIAFLVVSGAGLDVLRGRRMQLPYDPDGREALLNNRTAAAEMADLVPPDEPVLSSGNPAQMTLFGRRPAVSVPLHATPEQLRQVVDYYRLRYALVKADTAAVLESWGWRRVYEKGSLIGLVAD